MQAGEIASEEFQQVKRRKIRSVKIVDPEREWLPFAETLQHRDHAPKQLEPSSVGPLPALPGGFRRAGECVEQARDVTRGQVAVDAAQCLDPGPVRRGVLASLDTAPNQDETPLRVDKVQKSK